MNHDYAHCLDYTPDCPKECFRAQLQRDLEERRSEFIGVPLTCSHLGGTVECKLANSHNKVWKGEWIPVSERLPEEGWCLCTVHGVFYDYCEILLYQKRKRKMRFFRLDDDGEYVDFTDLVTAWMPLPEPWRGEEDE